MGIPGNKRAGAEYTKRILVLEMGPLSEKKVTPDIVLI
jgi:hypothetical protein